MVVEHVDNSVTFVFINSIDKTNRTAFCQSDKHCNCSSRQWTEPIVALMSLDMIMASSLLRIVSACFGYYMLGCIEIVKLTSPLHFLPLWLGHTPTHILWISSISSATAIQILLKDLTELAEKTFKLFQSQERELVNKYNYVVSLWRRVSGLVLLPFPFLAILPWVPSLSLSILKKERTFYLLELFDFQFDNIVCFSDFNCYWRIALWGCHKTATYPGRRI